MTTLDQPETLRATTARWYFAATRSRFWRGCMDADPALIAFALPWSTTAVIVILPLWLIAIAPTFEPKKFAETLRRPISWLPVAFFGLAVVGTLWAGGQWGARLLATGPAAKLLLIPLLIYHYERSSRAHWVFIGFVASCCLLLAYSFLIFVDPGWQFTTAHGFDTTGIPIRNAIDQNQEFALCAFGLAAFAIDEFRRRRVEYAAIAATLAALFVLNILFVALARTALIYLVVLAVVLVGRHISARWAIVAFAAVAAGVVAAWLVSPYLRSRVEHVAVEYREYRETHRPTSTGQRLEYWSSAAEWIKERPIIGHGTGSVRRLFDAAAVGKEGAWADSVGNPHNQTLYVAVQWGLLGCIVLFAMWYRHFRHFAGGELLASFGAIVVLQNVLSSLFNSHLFDFAEGWIYVLGVGVAGGALTKSRAASPAPTR